MVGLNGELEASAKADTTGLQKVLLVGNPNVGKSALFNALTGRYVTVSNYPGTTVEVSRGRWRLPNGTCGAGAPAACGAGVSPAESDNANDALQTPAVRRSSVKSAMPSSEVELIDTPGMYSLLPITDEERVARALLLEEDPKAVIHVIDAKSIQRMLGLTLQLIQAELPVVLVLNMSDEAAKAGVNIDIAKLEQALGIPVVSTIATSRNGLDALSERTSRIGPPSGDGQHNSRIDYGPIIERAVAGITPFLPPRAGAGKRARALLLLQGDADEGRSLKQSDPSAADDVSQIIWEVLGTLKQTVHYHTSMAIQAKVDDILAGCTVFPARKHSSLASRLSDVLMNPLTGFPILLLVLYVGLYKFVGQFGAGTMVNFLEGTVFQQWINPWMNKAVDMLPWAPLRELFGGDFGIVTLGIRYAVAIVLPIVGTFFLAFSVLEDSGYLPRLAMLVDRIFKKIGLNGRAVIPMVLGFGCDTMATMVTRTLETRRERVIATFLLALAIPCSAQMGVILGLLAGHPAALLAWAGIIIAVFLAAGLAAAKFLPGPRPSFYMELPPLRPPRISNVLVKTYTRMVWYFKEILPLFIVASVLIWIGRMTGVFDLLVDGLKPVVQMIGLPADAATAFLFGFFRRDYGVAGLYDLHQQGKLAGNQLLVAAVTLTLFLPCVAQLLVMHKERGLKMTLLISAFIAIFALAMGFLVNMCLGLLRVQL